MPMMALGQARARPRHQVGRGCCLARRQAVQSSAKPLWFTGQSGWVGKVAVRTGEVSVRPSPRGRGPYGICATPSGDIWWCSLAGSFIARVDRRTGESQVVQPVPASNSQTFLPVAASSPCMVMPPAM